MSFKYIFNLNDEKLLKRIIKKFTAASGVKVLRSCKRMKELIEGTKPVWEVDGTFRYMWLNGRHNGTLVRTFDAGNESSSKLQPVRGELSELIRIRNVYIPLCGTLDQESWKVIQPDLKFFKELENLLLFPYQIDLDYLLKLLLTTRPKKVTCHWAVYRKYQRFFQSVENLSLMILARDYWKDGALQLKKIGQNRTRVTLSFFGRNVLPAENFLKEWLYGEQLGTLESFSIMFKDLSAMNVTDYLEEMMESADIRRLANHIFRSERLHGDFLVERQDGDCLKVSASGRNITFEKRKCKLTVPKEAIRAR